MNSKMEALRNEIQKKGGANVKMLKRTIGELSKEVSKEVFELEEVE